MSIYLGAGSTAHKMSKLYVGVGGQARQVQKVYVGINGQARLVYQSGSPIGSLAVGSIVKIKVNGSSRNFIVVHQGKPSSVYDSPPWTPPSQRWRAAAFIPSPRRTPSSARLPRLTI